MIILFLLMSATHPATAQDHSDGTEPVVLPINISLVPGISIGDAVAKETDRPIVNKVSFNVLAGQAYALEGVEFGSVWNAYTGYVRGAQFGGHFPGRVRRGGELAGGEVHRHHERALGCHVAPAGGVAARLRQHLPAQREDEPGLLGEGDEARRREQAPLGVVPADERLAADDRTRGQLDDRLVVERQPAALDRRRQRGPQLQALERARVDLGLEHLVTALAALLRQVDGDVGAAQEDLAGRAAARIDGDADRGRDRDLPAFDGEGLGDRSEDPVGDGEDLALAVGVLEEDGEVVAAEASRANRSSEMSVSDCSRRRSSIR